MFDHLSFEELSKVLVAAYKMGAYDTSKAILNEMRTRLSETEFHEQAVRQG